MGNLVILFFALATISSVISGFFIYNKVKGSKICNSFGIALTLTGIAFAVWSYTIITKPISALNSFVSLGLFIMLIAVLYYAISASRNLPKGQNTLLVATTAIFSIIIIIARFFYPSEPYFSENGLFFFNPQPIILFLELILLGSTILPAILELKKEISKTDKTTSMITTSSLIVALLGTFILLTTLNEDLLFLIGWVIGIAFLFLLLGSLGLFSKASQ